MAISISQLSFEHHRIPLGIAESEPRISWRFAGSASDWEQTSYDIEIKKGDNDARSFSIDSPDSLYVSWPDDPLEEAESAAVRARAHGLEGQDSTPWSDWVSVETGISSETWGKAHAIASEADQPLDQPKRPQYFRHEFDVPGDIVSARLYITALGFYEAEINGQRVGDYVLAPGWQSYHDRHVYDTYDVTEHLQSGGANVIGAVVGEGWYAGRMGFGGGSRNIFGDTIGLLSLLVIKLEDGTTIEIPSDDSWQASDGPIITSEIYDGEVYDARLDLQLKGWSTPSFNNTSSWHGTREISPPRGELVSPDQPPARRIEEIAPQEFFTSPSGKTLVDFGQNFVGWLKIRVNGPAGTNITLRHAEVLENGELAIEPLRSAAARDNITLGGEALTWEPKFTFHGFRFAQIDGWPEEETPLDADSITGVVVHTDLEQTGWFESSHELLNRFHSNVRWSMKGNFLSIPTDCPQRDERLGWTGDAHAFGPTSNFLYNTAGFWRSWHRDVWFDMSHDGRMVVPFYVPVLWREEQVGPTSVWGDVAVANPWNVYQAFGDVGLLREHLPQAQNWIDTGIARNEVGLWDRSTFQFADWLDPLAPPDSPGDATTHKHLVSDAYLVRMTEILSEIAFVLGDDELSSKYRDQRTSLVQEFNKAWVVDGALANRTQTAYALALDFNLLGEEERVSAAETLRNIIEENDYLVGTGFAGTPALGSALHHVNSTDYFYEMLLQTKVPSWLYQVVQNGTTTWERWDSLLEDGSVNPGEMTSFNHYAFGAVASWIHEVIGGIAPAEPGYKRIVIAPVPGGGITHANTKLISPYGDIECRWHVDEGGFHLEVVVPPNTKADVTIPGQGETVTVGSGHHQFSDPDYEQ